MAVNKVVINTPDGEDVLIDLTNDSVTPETLAAGETAHDASGNVIAGEMPITTVLYTPQILTDEQKAQARENIGAEQVVKMVSLDAPSSLTLEDGTEYHLTNVSNLTITYPAGSFECYIYLTTYIGEITVVFPESKYIGSSPNFDADSSWEISVKDGVIVAGVIL